MNKFKEKLEYYLIDNIKTGITKEDTVSAGSLFDKDLAITSEAQDILKQYDYPKFEHSYNLLKDDYSKDLFVKLIIYRILGHARFQLPLANTTLWQEMFNIEKLCKTSEAIQNNNQNFYLFDLTPIGYNYKVFSYKESIFIIYNLGEYEYNRSGVNFKAEEGDYVIDGGAFVGETALYFADYVGNKGKVFSFEFEKNNLKIFQKNLELNPHLKDRINVYENALWSKSNEILSMSGVNACSHITTEEKSTSPYKIQSKSLDDFVEEETIQKIDFIKLDIEGAELECLKGAQKTIDKFKPKLAVCIYHKLRDFAEIPEYIEKNHPYYDFYIDHHTACTWETVLYCVPKSNK